MSESPPRPEVRPWRRALPWVVAAILLAGLGLPVVGGAFGHLAPIPAIGYARPMNATTITINMTDQPRFTPAYISVPEGSNATFSLVNQGNYTHTFTLLAQPGVVLNTSWTPTQIDQYIHQNGSLANVSVAPGGTGSATISFNASTAFDSFEFLSVVPYQFQAGMYGFVNVTSTGPGLMSSENTTDSYAFVPDVLYAAPSHYPFNLDVLVMNTGALGHTFTLEAQSNNTLSPANFTQYFQMHPPLVSVNVPSGAGSTVWANFTVAAPGIYQYICEVSGHFANGMTGQLYVGILPPPPAPAPSTAVIQGWILVGSGVLLAVGIVLAAATAYMGRFPEPPPSESHH